MMRNRKPQFSSLVAALSHLQNRQRGVRSDFNDRLNSEFRLNFVLVCGKEDQHYIDYIDDNLKKGKITRFYLMARGEYCIQKAVRISRFLRAQNILNRGRISRGIDHLPDGPVPAIVIQMFAKDLGSSARQHSTSSQEEAHPVALQNADEGKQPAVTV